ncbi:sigma-70 family RNA polymerase sigma factor [Salipaludibacillus sp. CF4.18]|uniref:sigma-70 family RNA polymerase sigma factor n=1 Tax=Salipaludibacillus sp. CF4.18 TaxID=3373081 RepID=UPI003EE51C4A
MNRKEIEDIISAYRLMKREIDRLDDLIRGIGSGGSSGNNGVAPYGIEATMPRGSKGISQSELDQLDRRERKLLTRMRKYQDKVDFVESAEELLEDPMLQIVYSCMMEGLSYRAIGKHIAISREQVRRLRDDIINQLCQNNNLCQSWQYLNREKQLV